MRTSNFIKLIFAKKLINKRVAASQLEPKVLVPEVSLTVNEIESQNKITNAGKKKSR